MDEELEEPVSLIIAALMDRMEITEFSISRLDADMIQGGIEASHDIINGVITFRRVGKDAA